VSCGTQEAGINMIESAYRIKPLKYRSWKLLEQTFEVNQRPLLSQFYN
jgi:hypothetical protein